MRASTLLVVFDSCAPEPCKQCFLVHATSSQPTLIRPSVGQGFSPADTAALEGLPHTLRIRPSVGRGFSPADAAALKGCPTCYESVFVVLWGRASALLTRHALKGCPTSDPAPTASRTRQEPRELVFRAGRSARVSVRDRLERHAVE